MTDPGGAVAPGAPTHHTTSRTDVAGPAGEAMDAETERPARRRNPALTALKETVIIVVTALVLSFLIKTFLVQPFYIPSASMHETLLEGDRVLANKLAPAPFDVNRGDVVVFLDPGGWLPPTAPPQRSTLGQLAVDVGVFVGLVPTDAGEHLIKRVVGVAGDTVECCDAEGRVTVNGVAIDETYLATGSDPSEVEFSAVVPPDSLWVMGDNRQNSEDSRYHLGDPGGGAIPVDNVVGISFVKIWPVDRMATMRNPGEVFDSVPAPADGG